MARNCLLLSIVLVMIFTLSACGSAEPTIEGGGEQVIFPDPNLEAAIREAIDKPEGPIYASELEGLTSLSASRRNITDLTGLQYCANLTRLSLYSNQISDISPLASLTNLTRLSLGKNQISDIEPLVANTGLSEGDTVFLGNNPLNYTSVNIYIPQLQERGVNVRW